MATEELFKEFPPVPTASWEQVIHADLKGADYAKKLLWQTPEGLAVRPYYRAEDLAPDTVSDAYRRGACTTSDWLITEEVNASDPEHGNAEARAAIAAGAEAIAFTGASAHTLSELSLLLSGLDEIPVHFADADENLLMLLAERLTARAQTATISANWNPLENADFAAKLLASFPAKLIPFSIDASDFEESGATAVEEVGLALAAGIDALAALTERQIPAETAAASLGFNFSIGANLFFQIAKFRAFRLVWTRAAGSFGIPQEAANARISARTSRWNQTVYDADNNILRGTSEALAAVLGGADSIVVAPFDECFRAPSEASKRLARNTQLILKHEAHFGRVIDPGGGSYYLETLTDFLARKGWELMQKIESAGGYYKIATAGTLAGLLAQSQGARSKLIHQRRSVLTGVNQFANAAEQALEKIDPSRMERQRRAAQPFEQLRLRTERHAKKTGKSPRILLAEIGDRKLSGLRSQFAGDFLACAGFVLTKQHFDEPAAIAMADADAIVLCSSDPEYPALATALLAALAAAGRTTPLLIAGNPDSAQALKAAGVADFLHLRSNPIELLTSWQLRLGIEA